MHDAVLELLDPGLGVALQDLGRRGWKRFGVPPGGALDEHAACWANMLLGNPLNAPVLEILLQGACFRAVERVELALTGAALVGGSHRWRTWVLEAGEELLIPPPAAGVWTYLATAGGFVGPRWFGSVSIFPRGGLGESLVTGALLHRPPGPPRIWPNAVGHRWVDPTEQRDYTQPPALRAWRGPQWDLFPPATQNQFFTQEWRISSRSDRTGYRLEGPSLPSTGSSLPSEPTLPGSVQVPPDGSPIVTLRDGPTVGGYPKLALVDPGDLSWLVQCRPGQGVRFVPAENGAAPASPAGPS